MKLSLKQKEVIRLMRDGWQIGLLRHTGIFWLCHERLSYTLHNYTQLRIHHNTARALFCRKLTELKRKNNDARFYTLTDLGKTIEIGEVQTEIKKL